MIITPFFWALLYPILEKKDWAIGRFGEAMDHALPLMCLLVEFFFCSNLPFVRRHFPLFFMISMVYMGFNCWYSLTYSPIYPVLTWKGASGFLAPIGTFFVAIVIFFTLEYF